MFHPPPVRRECDGCFAENTGIHAGFPAAGMDGVHVTFPWLLDGIMVGVDVRLVRGLGCGGNWLVWADELMVRVWREESWEVEESVIRGCVCGYGSKGNESGA